MADRPDLSLSDHGQAGPPPLGVARSGPTAGAWGLAETLTKIRNRNGAPEHENG